ncbi:hypothetical protein IC582_024884 [Cucumis melo]
MQSRGEVGGKSSPKNDRREILELEFPDDCLLYLRKIKNTSSGSIFYLNPKVKLNHVSRDEAYDASRMIVSKVNVDADENVYKVASKIVGEFKILVLILGWF